MCMFVFHICSMISAIMEMAEKRLIQLQTRSRVIRPASDLVVGLQCGGSDAFSGVTANPAVGYAADLLVRAGATVMFSEVTEVRDVVQMLAGRAVDESVDPEMSIFCCASAESAGGYSIAHK